MAGLIGIKTHALNIYNMTGRGPRGTRGSILVGVMGTKTNMHTGVALGLGKRFRDKDVWGSRIPDRDLQGWGLSVRVGQGALKIEVVLAYDEPPPWRKRVRAGPLWP